jgi:hypothetical protein
LGDTGWPEASVKPGRRKEEKEDEDPNGGGKGSEKHVEAEDTQLNGKHDEKR